MQDEASRAAAEAARTASDEALQKAITLKRLRTALAAKKLVIITGVGVTLDATGYVRDGDLEHLTWKGLIEHGFRYLEMMCRPAVSDQKKTRERSQKIVNGRYLLSQPDTDSHLLAAQILRKELEGEDHFATWLDSVFDNLEIKNEAVLRGLKALHARGATLLTTNYDHLLDRYCNLETIRRTATNDLLRFRRGRLFKDGVFHIHGSYQDPDDVVLDPIDYYKVNVSPEVQSFLQKCLLDDTVLFVGCGDGLGDANFSALLSWITEKHRKIAHTHCLLITNVDQYNFKPLVRLKYGARHSDLGPWLLNELLGDSPETERVDSCTNDLRFEEKTPFRRVQVMETRPASPQTISSSQPSRYYQTASNGGYTAVSNRDADTLSPSGPTRDQKPGTEESRTTAETAQDAAVREPGGKDYYFLPGEKIRQDVLEHQLKILFGSAATAKLSTLRVSPVREHFTGT